MRDVEVDLVLLGLGLPTRCPVFCPLHVYVGVKSMVTGDSVCIEKSKDVNVCSKIDYPVTLAIHSLRLAMYRIYSEIRTYAMEIASRWKKLLEPFYAPNDIYASKETEKELTKLSEIISDYLWYIDIYDKLETIIEKLEKLSYEVGKVW